MSTKNIKVENYEEFIEDSTRCGCLYSRPFVRKCVEFWYREHPREFGQEYKLWAEGND